MEAKGLQNSRPALTWVWHRRSSGRVYNSHSGHDVLIGSLNGKTLGYGSRITNCKRKCVQVIEQGNKHSCRIYWGGSAKAMESDY